MGKSGVPVFVFDSTLTLYFDPSPGAGDDYTILAIVESDATVTVSEVIIT